jgi:hypothetical protein
MFISSPSSMVLYFSLAIVPSQYVYTSTAQKLAYLSNTHLAMILSLPC